MKRVNDGITVRKMFALAGWYRCGKCNRQFFLEFGYLGKIEDRCELVYGCNECYKDKHSFRSDILAGKCRN